MAIPGSVPMVNAFLDQSDGNARMSAERFRSLACVVAPPNVWAPFNDHWSDVLHRYGVDCLHMRLLYQLRGPFSTARKWSKERRAQFLDELLKVFYHVIGQPNTFARTVTVSLNDHARAVAAHPGILPSPECLCTFWCMSQICEFYKNDDFAAFFDRGEPFFNTIYRHWQRRRKAGTPAWLHRIVQLEQGCAQKTLPLQAADLLGLEINRLWTHTHLRAPSKLPVYIEGRASIPNIPMRDKPEGIGVFLVTQSKRWEYDDFEHLAQNKKVADIYSLCSRQS